MNPILQEIIAFKVLIPIWLLSSAFIIYKVFFKGDVKNKPFWNAFALSHLLSPAIFGAGGFAFPLPATYGIYAFFVAALFGDLWAFPQDKAIGGIILMMIFWLPSFFVFWLN